MTVAELLYQSLAALLRRQQGRVISARDMAALRRAYDLRRQAQEPKHA